MSGHPLDFFSEAPLRDQGVKREVVSQQQALSRLLWSTAGSVPMWGAAGLSRAAASGGREVVTCTRRPRSPPEVAKLLRDMLLKVEGKKTTTLLGEQSDCARLGVILVPPLHSHVPGSQIFSYGASTPPP